MFKLIKTSPVFLGYLLAFLGVILFSAKAVLIKLAYQYDIDHLSLLLLRMAMALPFYVTIALLSTKKNSGKIGFPDWVWLVVFGFLGYYLASLFDFIGLLYIKASLERLVLFVYPTIVLLLSRIFLKTRFQQKQVIAIMITYAGLVLAFYNEVHLGEPDLILGAFFIFLSAVCYAGYLVGSGWLIPKFGATIFTSYAMIISCGCILLHYLFTRDFNLFDYPSSIYWLALAMAVLSTVLPSYLVSWSIKSIGAPNFSIVGSFGPISTILLAYVFLAEDVNLFQGIGTIVVIFGVLLSSRKN